jgi:hypothetical protein
MVNWIFGAPTWPPRISGFAVEARSEFSGFRMNQGCLRRPCGVDEASDRGIMSNHFQ